ncbi:MAG TPA: TetR/AcrR family transcriptional regulator [Pseudonocardia sp.]|nr:TetR/AcrR family transcriptional regulator [Pseudonocardia sp.]
MVRGKERVDAILASTVELLTEVGYQALTMDAVAARAQASKATIYRRWSNKAALVRAALDDLDAGQNAAVPETGTLRGDFLAVMAGLRERATAPYLAMIADLVAATRHDEQLAAELRLHLAKEELSPFHEALAAAVRRGELPADVDFELIHDVAEAMIQRQLAAAGPFDDAFTTRVVDDVLLVLLANRKDAP